MLALIYLGLAIAVGDRLCGYFFRYISAAHRWATATLVGLLLSACFTYQAGRHFAVATNPLLWGDILFFAGATLFLLKCPPRRDPGRIVTFTPRSATCDWVTLGLFCVLVCWMMFATLTFKENRIAIGINQWSDYGPNTAIVQNFAFGHNFPAEYPHYAGEPIRYHFLFYFVAGNLEFLGLNLAWSLNILSIITMISLLALVMAFGELLFKSRAVGIIAAAFFFFHGTLNLVPFLKTQTQGKLSWESIKVAARAAYNLGGYLSSGYPYRGEDWGIWTQVVYVNQRHLASSIGIFLVVLIFLFDRYLEKAKEWQLRRALARSRPASPPPADQPLMAGSPPTHFDDRERITSAASGDEAQPQTPTEVQAAEQSMRDPEPSGGVVEPLEVSTSAANYASEGDTRPSDALVYEEQPHPLPETSAIGTSESSRAVEPLTESAPVANYASEGEVRPPDTLAYGEPSHPLPEATAGGPAEPSGAIEFQEAPAGAVNEVLAGEPPTFATRAYDEYMHLEPDAASVSKAEKAEGPEFVPPSSQEPEPGLSSETESPPPEPALAPVSTKSRHVIAELVHDNLVNGKSFIFCGLLLGALPYWNAPVFTASAAVLAFLFVLFPCRRYMIGLAITAAVVALPQIMALRAGNTRSGASLIHWGYTLGAVPVMQVVKYLWWTFGLKWVFILLALLFFSWRNLRFFIAIFSLFLLTFCFQFSDEGLANHKFLNIWLVLANLFFAYGLWRLWRLRIWGWALPSRLVALALVSPIVLGGVIDLFPLHNLGYIETNYTKDRLIDWIRTETKPDAVFVSDKFVNHPILLAGRKIFFGYTYFTWGAGYDLSKREPAYKLMFESKNAHQVFTLLKANHIDYVAIDDGIRGVFKNINEEQVYVPNFKKVFDGSEYWKLAIYKVPENADFVPASTTGAVPGSTPIQGISVFEGGKGKDHGQFDFPRGLAVDNAGNILVADTNNGRIQKFSSNGAFISVIGKPGQGPGEFKMPGGIAIDASGNIYVADVENHRVQKLKPDGTFVTSWKGPDVGFYGPRDITIGPDDSIYVVDEGHAHIVKFDTNGKALALWGSTGKEDGQFGDATSVAVDGKNNRVYVADPGNQRIQVFDTYGKFIAKWTVNEWRPTGWSFQDLVIDPQTDRLYASSVSTDEVLVYDLTGKKIDSIKPNPPDRFEGASSLALAKRKLYALNTYGNRLSAIDLPPSK